MKKKILNTKERILYLSEVKEDSKRIFFEKIKATYGNFTGKSKDSEPSNSVIREILLNYPDVNPLWLISGSGKMIESKQNNSSNELIINEIQNNFMPKGAIPFYNLPVTAGQSAHEIEGAIKPDGYIKDFPGVSNTELFLPVQGYSMYPEIKEGAIIGVRKMERIESLNTQHKYMIITRDDRMVKYIEHDETNPNILWCKSPNYQKFKIYKEDIIEVNRVTLVINPE